MPQWFWLIAFLVGYIVLTQWLLPKLGVPTWRSNGCVESRRDNANERKDSMKAAVSKKEWSDTGILFRKWRPPTQRLVDPWRNPAISTLISSSAHESNQPLILRIAESERSQALKIMVSAAGLEPATHALKGSPTQLQTRTCTSSLLHARHNKIKEIQTRHRSGCPEGARNPASRTMSLRFAVPKCNAKDSFRRTIQHPAFSERRWRVFRTT